MGSERVRKFRNDISDIALLAVMPAAEDIQ
jgi:hypothetical protein